MSPLLKKVENAGIKGIKRKRKPFHLTSDDFFNETETIRVLYSQLINNDEPKRVVIIPSVSYGLANVVNNLPFSSGKILLAEEQFPSNVYPWMSLTSKGFEVEILTAPQTKTRGQDWNAKFLAAIDEKTRVVALGHVHWSDGTLFDLKAIRERLDKVGGLLIVDGTQSVGALPFDVKEIRPDALICAAYKWIMGPYSIGLAYYGDVFDNGKPVEEHWANRMNADNFAGLVNYEPNYREVSLRYEVGEHGNFILVPMLHEALKQVLRWSPQAIQAYCKNLLKPGIDEMISLGYRIEEDAYRASHLFGVRLDSDMDMAAIKNSFQKHRVNVSFRGDAIRIAPHVYNDETDVRKLLKAMKEPIFASK